MSERAGVSVWQDEEWCDIDGQYHRIIDMEPRYRDNVVAFLWRQMPVLRLRVEMADLMSPFRPDDLDTWSNDPDEEWFDSLPLVEALRGNFPLHEVVRSVSMMGVGL